MKMIITIIGFGIIYIFSTFISIGPMVTQPSSVLNDSKDKTTDRDESDAVEMRRLHIMNEFKKEMTRKNDSILADGSVVLLLDDANRRIIRNIEEIKTKGISVYFATDRKIIGSVLPISKIFGAERGDGNLKYGVSAINIPPDHQTGSIERPSIWTWTFDENPNSHVMAIGSSIIDEGIFFDSLRDDIKIANRKEILLYIHGFNTQFYDALLQAGQIKYDLKFEGAMAMYSWPSGGDFGITRLTSYTADEAAASWSTPHLTDFLKNLRDLTGARAVHIVAHSMGNRLVSAALENLYYQDQGKNKLGHVVMAAPDVDAMDFKQRAQSILPTSSSTTIYANDDDVALAVSKQLAHMPRLGQSRPNPTVIRDAFTIDASSIKTDFVGHSYYRDNLTVISDIYELLEGRTPENRHFLRKSPDGTYWRFVR